MLCHVFCVACLSARVYSGVRGGVGVPIKPEKIGQEGPKRQVSLIGGVRRFQAFCLVGKGKGGLALWSGPPGPLRGRRIPGHYNQGPGAKGVHPCASAGVIPIRGALQFSAILAVEHLRCQGWPERQRELTHKNHPQQQDRRRRPLGTLAVPPKQTRSRSVPWARAT